MEGLSASINGATHLPAVTAEEGTPFSREVAQLTKQEAVQLKWEAGYWKALHDRLVVRSAERENELKAQQAELLARNDELEQQLERALARIRDLKQRLYGKRSEKRASKPETQVSENTPSRARGQAPGTPGHGRTPRPHLPVVEERRTLPPEDCRCPHCQQRYLPRGTEDSEIIEIRVEGYVRRIKRQRYEKACDCLEAPVRITAPPAPRLIPRSTLGVSVWVEVLLGKYLHSIPTNRWCTNLESLGVSMAQGTLTGGLQKLMPLFEPVRAALLEKHLTERLFHGDETGWKVFAEVAGKIGHRWFLWLTRSASVVYFWMAPGRGAKVLQEHFATLSKDVLIILVCDRYKAYQCWAKDYPRVLAHVLLGARAAGLSRCGQGPA